VVNYVESILQREGIKYNKLKMPLATESEMVATVFRSAGVIIGAPTYEYKLFPPVASALNELGRKRITGKTAFRFGSYGWSGGAEKELADAFPCCRNYSLPCRSISHPHKSSAKA